MCICKINTAFQNEIDNVMTYDVINWSMTLYDAVIFVTRMMILR